MEWVGPGSGDSGREALRYGGEGIITGIRGPNPTWLTLGRAGGDAGLWADAGAGGRRPARPVPGRARDSVRPDPVERRALGGLGTKKALRPKGPQTPGRVSEPIPRGTPGLQARVSEPMPRGPNGLSGILGLVQQGEEDCMTLAVSRGN